MTEKYFFRGYEYIEGKFRSVYVNIKDIWLSQDKQRLKIVPDPKDDPEPKEKK